MLTFIESMNFLKKQGINIASFKVCEDEDSLINSFIRMKKPVVLKAVGDNIVHKTEEGAVSLNIYSKERLLNEFNRLKRISNTIIIQEQKKGVELIIGLHDDDVFGKLIMIGIGGVYAELLNDVSFRSCPISENEAKRMVNELKLKKLLYGYRNMPKVNIKILLNLLSKISNLNNINAIKTMDINPIIFDNDKYYAVDARIEYIN